MRLAFATLLGVLSLIPCTAWAGCRPGEQPSYEDVRRIQIRRYALVGRTYPRFSADFQLSFLRGDPNALSAQLDAQKNVRLLGTFAENDASTFEKLRAVLAQRKFYDLRLTPRQAYYLDGPEDQLVVTRCGVATTIGDFVEGEVDQENGQVAAMRALFDALQSAIFSLPWLPVTPSPSPSP